MGINQLSRKNLYWACQLGGWGVYSLLLVGIYITSDRYQFTYREGISTLVTFGLSVSLTHLLRHFIRTRNIYALPLSKLIPTLVLANILLAFSLLLTTYVVDYFLGIISKEFAKNYTYIFISLVNMTTLFLIWTLIYSTFYYITKLRREEIERLRWEGAIKDFELNKLKSQLNPHFVFNALNGIRSLIDEDPQKAKQGITQLSNILRNSLLADRSKTISLAEELKTVNDYLQLEKLRYEERLHTHLDIEPESLRVQVPPMMIQTLVENAVKHGISKVKKDGFIAVEAHVKNNFLEIEIRNTGKLNGIESGGFGVLNTKQRLDLLYGSPATFDLFQENPDVVHANLKIPIR
jgi:two-component system, LytTR family, sensor kinase